MDMDGDTFDYRMKLQREFKLENNIPLENKIISWQGSPTHVDSLMLIYHVINAIIKRTNVTVILASDASWLKSIGFKESKNLKIIGWMSLNKVLLFSAVSDVCLTPLPNNAFNQRKSELKVLESAAWGIPSVSSPVAPYLRFNKISGGGNIIVKEKYSSWMKAILTLLEDEVLYKEKSTLSLQSVKDHYDLTKINKQRADWWQSILK